MLEVNNISFAYGDFDIISNIDFQIKRGQNVSILGESGCGKSTFLRLLCGLHDLREGTIRFEGELVLGPDFHLVPGEEEMKLLPQDFDLMPFVSVSENIGKYLTNFDLEYKKQRVNDLLQMIEMQDFADTHARYLSGGQKQRVALARAIAVEPKLLLLDEPFNQIDGFRKNAFRRNLFNYLKQRRISCIVATHDSIDALSFSDQVLVMKKGAVVTQDDPISLYENPPSKYVASLFGEVNEIEVKYIDESFQKEEKVLVYPHELEIDLEAQFKVVVMKSYFKGGKYLVQAHHNKKVIFFDNNFPIESSEIIGLKVDKSILEKRIK